MSKAWVYKGVNYLQITSVMEAALESKNLDEAFEMIKKYCEDFSHGRSNLAYFYNNPFFYLYRHFSPWKTQREAAKDALKEVERLEEKAFCEYIRTKGVQ